MGNVIARTCYGCCSVGTTCVRDSCKSVFSCMSNFFGTCTDLCCGDSTSASGDYYDKVSAASAASADSDSALRPPLMLTVKRTPLDPSPMMEV